MTAHFQKYPALPIEAYKPSVSGRLRRRLMLSVVSLLAFTAPALAQTTTLPSGGAFVRGQGQITQSAPNVLSVNQSSLKGIIDWTDFSIAADNSVLINNANGATLNRVMGGEISRIDGLLKATGSVYLMNPNGVIVGAGGRILSDGNTVVTTRQMDMDAFMNGGPLTAAGTSSGAVINKGHIQSHSGSVVLIGRSVSNSGRIEAANGQISLAAANEVLMATTDGQADNLYVSVKGGTGDITQTGRIEGAAVTLQSAGGNIFALAGNRDGLVQATGTETIDGALWLSAPKGTVEVAGKLAAQTGDKGGFIQINAKDITLTGTAKISARGTSGGEILIGTTQFGSGQNLADRTTIQNGATITAGGPSGGGRIETSAKTLDVGAATITAGQGGQWLLDPDDLTIDTAAATTLATSLNAGTNVTQSTTAGGTGGSGDITVAAPVTWTGTGNLTLNAYRNLNLNAAISGGGSITLTAVKFTNTAGANALRSTGGKWLVYSANPANDAAGGLTPDFYQYNAAAGATPAAAGNGLLYSIAPSVNITLGTITKAYDGTTLAVLDDSNTTVTGLINSDDWTLDGAYSSKNAGTGLTVTGSNFAATHNGIDVFGYSLATPAPSTSTAAITRAMLTASIISTPTKTYNGTTTASNLTSANYGLTGVAAGETITVNSATTVAYNSANAGARTLDATFTTPNFTAGSGTLLTNYVLPTTATGAGLINQAPIQINSLSANSKVYDGNLLTTLNTASAQIFGVIGSDNVTLNTASAAGLFGNKNVGDGKTVLATGLSLSGSSAANYVIVQPTGLTANITPASLTVSNVTANNKVYDGSTTATLNVAGATRAGLISGDVVTIDTSAAQINFASKNVGTNIGVSATGVTLGGADAGNYTLGAIGTLQANITARPLTAAITGNPTRVYNGTTTVTLSQSNYSLTGFASGEGATVFQLSGVSYSSKNAGTRTITANVAPSDYNANAGTLLSNYILPTTVTGTGTITQASVTIDIIGNPTKAYDGNATATLTPANYDTNGFIAGEGVTITQTVGTYSSADSGTRNVTATIGAGDLTADSGTLLSNYLFPTTTSGIGTITRVVIGGNVNASIINNPTKIYDGNTVATLTSANYSLTGFVNGDGATVTETVGQYSSADAGLRAVIAFLTTADFVANSGTNLNNYVLPTEATGTGTITRAPLTGTIIGNPTKVYNGSTRAVLSAANYSFSGFVSGQGMTVSGGFSTEYDSANAGARTLTVAFPSTTFIANSGTKLTNYILPTTATGAGTITRAPLTITNVTAQNRVYDTTTNATLNLGGAALFGVIATDTITLDTSGANASFATKTVGNGKAITATGFALTGAGQSNYQLFQPTGLTANITPKSLSILNVTAQNKTYDALTTATLNLGTASLSGVLGSDVVTFSTGAASGVFSQSHAGNNLAVTASGFAISGTDAGNYSLSQPTGLIANINQKALTASIIGNPTKTYDGGTSVDLSAANFSLTGFVASQGATVPQSSTAAYDSADAGARTVTATLVSSDFVANAGTDLSNYVLPTTGSGAGTINKANLIIALIGNPTKVYDNTTNATLTSANYSLAGFVSGQGATVTGTAGLYDSDNAGARNVTATLTGGDFTATGSTNLANYNLPTTASGAGTITKASVNVISVTAQNKVYDGTRNATLNTGSANLSGVFGGDTVNVVSTSASGLFASKNVGTGVAVTASGFTLSGTDAVNYTVVQPTGLSANITIASLSLASVTKVYDAGTLAPTTNSAYTLAGVFGSDVVSVNAAGISGAYATKNVGTGIGITLSGVAITGADAANYTIASTTTNTPIGIITPASLTVIGAIANDKVYDRTLTATLNNSGAALSGRLGADDVILVSGGSSGVFSDVNVGTNKTVTASGYTVQGSDAANYMFTQPTGLTADITPKLIALTSVIKTYDGTTALPTASSAYGFTGVISGDTVTANAAGVSGSYGDKNAAGSVNAGIVTNGILVTASGLALSGAGAGNYTVGSVTNSPIGVINRKLLTAAIIGTPTKTYNRTTAAALTSANYQITGFVSGEGATVTETAGLYSSANAGSRTVTATLASNDFTANGATLLSNYTLPATATGAGLINRAPLTITGVLATNKVYNGNTSDPLNVTGAALNGVVAGDTTGLNSSGATGTFASPDVGTHIAVTATGFTLTNDPNNNYILSQPTGLFADITQAMLTLTRVERVYTAGTGLPTSSTSYTLGGFVSGDVVSVNTAGLSGNYATKNVGSGIGVTLTGLSLAGADATNYSIADTLTNASIGVITPATVTLTGMLANSKFYDGITALSLNNSNTAVVGRLGADSLGVNSAGSHSAFTSPNAGTYSVAATGYILTGADAGNYILIQPTGISATINRAILSAAIIGTPTRTYNGNTAATLTSANYALSGFVSGQGATVTETAGVYNSSNAGSRTVTATLASNDFTVNGGTLLTNYVLPTTASGTGLINKANLSAAIIGTPTKVYNGNTLATLTSANYALSGFISGEGATVTETSGLYSSANAGSRTVTATLANTDFTATGATLLSNYNLPTTATGTGLINKAALNVVIIGNPTRTYDGTTGALLAATNYSLTGFVSGEGATVTQTNGLYDSANAGARSVSASLASGDFTAGSGTLLSNYTLPTTATGAGTIDKAALTAVIIGTPTKTYDGNRNAVLTSANYSLSGFVSGQGATVTEAAGLYDSANAGSRSITARLTSGDFTATGATLLSNYILPVTATGTGLINRAALNVAIIGTPTKTYDGNTAASLTSANYSLTGFISGEGATITDTTGTYASANAGTRLVTNTLAADDFSANSGTLLSNYTLPVIASGSGLINKATLVATLNGVTKTYDGSTDAFLSQSNYTLSGFASGEGATITETSGVYGSKNAGLRTITAALDSGDFTADAGTSFANYNLPVVASGTGVITRASLNATLIGNPTKTYDGNALATLTSANYSLTGFVSGEGASVTQTTGVYGSKNAGVRTVTAALGNADFTANSGTLLSNYTLPVEASGTGLINRADLSVSLTNVTKTYDGTTDALLSTTNYLLTGFVSGEGATITDTSGTYASANAGAHLVTTTLASDAFVANDGTLFSNYVLPTRASGTGLIGKATLVATLHGVTKTYDGTSDALLVSAHYSLSGFVDGEGATITETMGLYSSPNAGLRSVTASLDGADFIADNGTRLSNYTLPTTATGTGLIDRATLTGVIIGDPFKTYDGTTIATLTSANFALSGFIGSEGATITQTEGAYDSANAGTRTITASLAPFDFAANGDTLLSNYNLPVTVSGAGLINQASLNIALIGNPTKVYDGTADAGLTEANYQLSGFVAGEGASVTETFGVYESVNAGSRTVTASLDAGDFTGNAGTLLSNYSLPTTATGTGLIDRATLTGVIIGNPFKTYDGSDIATLTSANFTLSGFVGSESATVIKTTGQYDSPNAGARTITAALDTADLTADAGTLLSNYILPITVSGAGQINRADLTIALIGVPTKTYNGNTTATLIATDYAFSGFVSGEGATVTQTTGLYDSPNAGVRTVSVSLGTTDISANRGTLLANYNLPTAVSGSGQIDKASLTAILIGTPTKVYDGTTDATLTEANYLLSGFIAGEGANVTETHGEYDSPPAGIHTVTAILGEDDFAVTGSTLLSNYSLPTEASGDGLITSKWPDIGSIIDFRPDGKDDSRRWKTLRVAYLIGNPRAYIPYPSSDSPSNWRTNGFAILPSILSPPDPADALDGTLINGGATVINSPGQILLQGDKGKTWHLRYPPQPANDTFAQAMP